MCNHWCTGLFTPGSKQHVVDMRPWQYVQNSGVQLRWRVLTRSHKSTYHIILQGIFHYPVQALALILLLICSGLYAASGMTRLLCDVCRRSHLPAKVKQHWHNYIPIYNRFSIGCGCIFEWTRQIWLNLAATWHLPFPVYVWASNVRHSMTTSLREFLLNNIVKRHGNTIVFE